MQDHITSLLVQTRICQFNRTKNQEYINQICSLVKLYNLLNKKLPMPPRAATRMKLFSLVFTFLVMDFETMRANGDVSEDHLIEFIRNNLQSYKVNAVFKSLEGLSPLAHRIIRRVNQDFPSENIGFDAMMKMENTSLKTDEFEESKHVVIKYVLERFSSTMGIVEIKNSSHAFHEMATMLEYFNYMNRVTRGKYLINLISDEEIDLESFFRFAWSSRFVNLVVIQWIQSSPIDKTNVSSTLTSECNVFVLSYNLFNETFSRQILDVGIEPISKKTKNFHKYPMVVMVPKQEALLSTSTTNVSLINLYYRSDINLLESLAEAMNCTLLIKMNRDGKIRPYDDRLYLVPDLMLPFSDIAWLVYSGINSEWILIYRENYESIFLPVPLIFHFHLLRPRVYERSFSFAAIVTFGGLAFTSWIFATWAWLLGFKEKNWSFLNIFTAQMGGSIKHHGRMKLSEMIYQMSIYIATFIIITLGTDYMVQFFVLNEQKLPDIKTLKDLADSDVDLIVEDDSQIVSRDLKSDPIVKKIFNRIRVKLKDSGSSSFCQLETPTSVIDGSINLCISSSRIPSHILQSNDKLQIDMIEEPFFVTMPFIQLVRRNIFYEDRLKEMVQRFSEVGLLKLWDMDIKRRQMSEKFEDPLNVEACEDSEVPFKDQIKPIFVVGYSLGIVALVFELIWKRFIEKTIFGELVDAFYSNSRPNSAYLSRRTHVNPSPGSEITQNLHKRSFLEAFQPKEPAPEEPCNLPLNRQIVDEVVPMEDQTNTCCNLNSINELSLVDDRREITVEDV